jgi:ATP synthase protein I
MHPLRDVDSSGRLAERWLMLKGKGFRKAGAWMELSIVGIQFPVAIAIGYFWGRWLDRWLGTQPWLTMIFALFGVAAGFVNLFRITLRATREEAAEAEGDDGAG